MYKHLLSRLTTLHPSTPSLAANEIRWMTEELLRRRVSRPSFLFSRPSNTVQAPTLADLHVESTVVGMTVQERRRLETWVEKRVDLRMPLQYVLGTQGFCGLDVKVRPPTLIPRWETEEWTMRLVSLISPQLAARGEEGGGRTRPFRILDLCTGSGCIAIALSHHLSRTSPYLHVTACDISKRALSLARVNTRRLGIPPSRIAVEWADVHSDGVMRHLGAEVDGFDLVVANPPYVTREEHEGLEQEVKGWEDRGALVAEDEGTAFHGRIAKCSKRFLLRKEDQDVTSSSVPKIAMEIGEKQGPTVKRLVESAGFRDVKVWKDLAGVDRCVVGY
ncbi:hypothetical protein HKX48_000774 [Thoreauomyces humboldtii]|nr:hypothetical protein HKX48_000774 [Thoreauomyces humboldtii]